MGNIGSADHSHSHLPFAPLIPEACVSYLQIRPSAETGVHLTREDHGSRGAMGSLIVQGARVLAQLGQELAGDGIARAGTIEREDTDRAGVRGGDVGDLDQGGGGYGTAVSDMVAEDRRREERRCEAGC